MESVKKSGKRMRKFEKTDKKQMRNVSKKKSDMAKYQSKRPTIEPNYYMCRIGMSVNFA